MKTLLSTLYILLLCLPSYGEAEYYYKMKTLYRENRNTQTPPTTEQLQRWNDSRLPPRLTQDDFSNRTINWPEFFLIGNQPEMVQIDLAMSGEMGFYEKMTVRASVMPLEARLYQYRKSLTGNERIRYRRFLDALRGHAFYMEKNDY